SKSSAMYIDNIEIEWEAVGAEKVFAPTFDPAAGMVKAGTEVTLATQTEGAEIYYTTDESEPTAESTKYTAPIAINDYTVIKAVAIANGNASEVVTAEYMLMPAMEDLSPLMDFPDKTPFTVNCELTVVYANGANVYVYDGTNYGLIYKNDLGLAAGDVIAAGWDAQLSIYSGLYEIVPETELTKSESEPKVATPMVVDAEDAEMTLAAYNMNRYFTLQDVVFDAATPAGKSNFTGKMGETEVTFRNNFEIESVEAGTYNVTGFVGVYNANVQFYPIAYVANEPEDPNTLWKSDVEAEQSTADWRRVFTMTAEEAQEKIAVGDYLLVTVSYVDPEGGWPQVAILPIEGWPPYTNEGVSKDAACPFVVRFPIAGPTAKQMWENGFGVSGGDVRISKVAIEKATEELDPNTVWFGGKQCGWGDGISLSKEIFANAVAGDKVVINYTPGSEATLQIMPGGWSGPNFPIYAGLPFFVRDEANSQMVFTLQADFDAYDYEVDGETKTFDIFALLKSDGLMMHGPCYVNSILYISDYERQAANMEAYEAAQAEVQALYNEWAAAEAEVDENYPGCGDEDEAAAIASAIQALFTKISEELEATATEGNFVNPVTEEEIAAIQSQIAAWVEAAKDAYAGISAVEAEEGAEYYSLQGVRLAKPVIGQPCIRVANGTATKVIVK
ncbi:MAG: chitobiase/beta-hexosaminidase C-terminal domain-containing protein, partial [Muribaculaceae bacterium]|nr:chitobiase/beta-hexosaminidase C-terminal domain-containing protein [Muribaculaceae bacterium]